VVDVNGGRIAVGVVYDVAIGPGGDPVDRAAVWNLNRGTVRLLPLPAGGISSEGVAISDTGWVVGAWSPTPGRMRAFARNPWTGQLTDLGDLGQPAVAVVDVDNRGRAVGVAYTPENEGHAFVWDRFAGMRDVGALEPGGETVPVAINEMGQVALNTSRSDGTTGEAGMLRLGRPGVALVPTAATEFALLGGLNDRGVAAGVTVTPASLVTAFRWKPGSYGLERLQSPAGLHADVRDISDSGCVVGGGTAEGARPAAFIWPAGRRTPVPLVPGPHSQEEAVAQAVSGRGDVVGNVGGVIRNSFTARPVWWPGVCGS
jgi:uncharacterized membrane protein